MRRWTFDARPILRRMVLCAEEFDLMLEKSCIKSLDLLLLVFGVDGGDSSEDAIWGVGVAADEASVSQNM